MQVVVIIFQLAAFDAYAPQHWDTRYIKEGVFLAGRTGNSWRLYILCELLAEHSQHMAT